MRVSVTVTVHARLYQLFALKHRSVLIPLIISVGLMRSDPQCCEATPQGSHTCPENACFPSCWDVTSPCQYLFTMPSPFCSSTLCLYMTDIPQSETSARQSHVLHTVICYVTDHHKVFVCEQNLLIGIIFLQLEFSNLKWN